MADTTGIDFEPSESQRAIRERAREAFGALADRRVKIQRPSSQDGVYPEDLWQALIEGRFLAALLAEEDGGSGEGVLGFCAVLEELAAADVGNFLPVLNAMVVRLIASGGTDELKRRVLPEILGGRRRACFALTERKAGFNAFRIETFARREGDVYVLHGEKFYISAVDVADSMVVVARTKDADECVREGLGKTYGLSAFLVDTAAPGLTREPIPTEGAGVLRQYRVSLESVEVPAGEMIGAEHMAALDLLGTFNLERVLTAALGVGVSRYCLERACAHARERVVFGSKPIGSYQAVQHPLAEVRLRQEAVRLLVERAAWAIDRGRGADEVGLYANAAKLTCVELGLKAVDAAIDALGGRGFEEETGMIRLWNAARLAKTSPISDALVLSFVAEHELELPRST